MSTKKNEVTKTFAQWTDTHWNVKLINNIPNITQYTDPFGTDTNSIPFTEDLLDQLVEKGKAMKPFKIYLKEGYAFIHGSTSDKGMEVDYNKVNADNLQWIAHVYGTPKADIKFTLNNDYYPGYVKCKTIAINADSKYYETKFKDYSWGKKIYISPSGGPILTNGASLSWYQGECVAVKEGYIMPTADQIKIEPESMRQYINFEFVFGSKNVYNVYMYNRWDFNPEKYNADAKDTVITFPKPEATFYQVDVNKSAGTTITNGSASQRVDIGREMQAVSLKVDDTSRMGFDPEVRPSKEGVTFNVDTLQSAPYKHGWVSGIPLRDVVIDIPTPVEFSSTSIKLGANLNVGSGKINQWNVKGKKITEVVINCADGYEFVQNSDTVTDFTPYFNKIVVAPESEKSNIKFNITGGQLHITGTISNDVSITLPEPVKKAYTVTVKLGENVVRESGGELTQDVRVGQPMNQIILKVDNTKVIGSFYANTHNGSKDGVNMTVDTSGEKPYTKLTVGGTPTNNTTVTIPSPSLGYLVKITGGANTTHVSGSLRQYVNAGENIETVIFRCNEGYWFGKYNGGSNNSMSIKLNPDKTELTLSGAPAGMSGFGDYDVRLEDAVPKPVTTGVVKFVDWPNIPDVTLKAGECLYDTSYNYETHELINMYNTTHPEKPCTWVESTLYPNVNFNATQLYMPEPPININVVAKFGTPPNDYGVVTINNAPNGNVLKIDWYPDEGFDIHISNGHIPLSNDGYFTELYLEPDFKTLVYSLITEHPTLGGPEHWWMSYPPKDMTMYAKFVKDESKYLTIYWGRDPNMDGFAWSPKWKTPIPWKVKAIDNPNTYICDPSSITFDSNYHEIGLTIGDLESNRPVYSVNYVDVQMWDPDPQYSDVNSFALSYTGDSEEWNLISIYEPEDTIVPIEIGVGTGGTTEYRLQYTGWGDIEPPPPDSPENPDEPGPGK